MNDTRRACLDPETLAAFVEGTLSTPELNNVSDHLLTCDECVEMVGAVALCDREESLTLRTAWPGRSMTRWSLAAAAALAIVIFWPRTPVGHDPIKLLVDATPHDRRYVEPRLTGGFPWAPIGVTRGDAGLTAGQMRLLGAAGAVLERTANNQTPDAKHAAAVAHVLAGQPRQASELLKEIPESTSNASIWNDRAAAAYAEAVAFDDPTRLAHALAAADAALRLNQTLPEALFNRALVIERLGLREQARTAWRHYIEIDSKSGWAGEARLHLQTLQPVMNFRSELQRQYSQLSQNPVVASTLARRFPQDARVWGETEILARWAAAVKSGDTAGAAAHLSIARAFGNELARTNGESMLLSAVTAIDVTDDKQRNALVEAQLLFRTAQRTYKAGNPRQAEMMFVDASRGFRHGGSTLALVANYFVANTIFDQGRISDARVRLQQLTLEAPPELAGLRAQVDWELGLVHASLGRWNDAMRALDNSIAAFERLGETAHATNVREVLAEVYERVGDYRMAQRNRLIAVRGETDVRRLQLAFDAAADSAASSRDWPVSISFLGLELDLTREDGDEQLYAQILLKRARMEHQIGRADMAATDLVRARRAIDRIPDPFMRESAEANYLAVAGLLAPSPASAVPLLTQAIEFQRTKGVRTRLPDIYLQRGRVLAALGKVEESAVDFELGICQLEEQKRSTTGEDQLKFAVVREDLFDEAIALALSCNDVPRAFAYAERARTSRLAAVKALSSRAPDSIIIEYAALSTRLVIFMIKDGGISAVQGDVEREALRREVNRLASSATSRDNAQFERAASELYDRILAPVAKDIAAGHTLVFVPDATLSAVPFAALRRPDGRYVVEQHAVVVAPSASIFMQLNTRPYLTAGASHLLLFGGPSRHDGEAGLLFSAQREAEAVAAVYGHRAEFAPKETVHSDFERRAASAEVIHFSGHAVDDNSSAALVTFGENGATERLTADEIAAMRLPHTRLVVLAACNTALDRENGLSLAQAFLAAGVPSVVATLWPIEDYPATEFFPRFHQHLAEGLSPADALRATQLEWLHRPDTSRSPSVWAAVQVIGSSGIAGREMPLKQAAH